MLMTMSVVEARRGRFQAKGNMRGTVNFASGLSPVQVKVMQLLARQRCLRHGRYGRCLHQLEIMKAIQDIAYYQAINPN